MKIIIVEPGTLTEDTAKQLREKGVVIIEHPQPDKVRVVTAESKIFTHDLLMSSLHAIDYSNSEKFTKELYRRLCEKEKGKKSVGAK